MTDEKTTLRPVRRAAHQFPNHDQLPASTPPPLRPSQPNDFVPGLEPSLLTDDELMHRFQSGDDQAFVELYKRRHKAIFTFCVRMCGGDHDLAKDAFQETFIRIHDRADQYRSDNFWSWCRSIARNVSRDLLRKHKPDRFEKKHFAIPTIDRADLPDFSLEQDILRTQIDRALAKLPLKLREPFILHEYEEMKIEEIANELHASEDAVRQRVWRARQLLRKILLPDYRS